MQSLLHNLVPTLFIIGNLSGINILSKHANFFIQCPFKKKQKKYHKSKFQWQDLHAIIAGFEKYIN